jgi:proteasome lid subunit RPN8/RPN11
MTPKRLTLFAGDIAFIRNAAATAFPDECCGLLVGTGDELVIVSEVVAAPNSAGDKRKHFAIDPQLQFDTLRASRDRGLRVVGHYHSHPNGRATPSAEDLAMAYDDSVWVIVPVTLSQAGMPRAFVRGIGGAGFTEIALSCAS